MNLPMRSTLARLWTGRNQSVPETAELPGLLAARYGAPLFQFVQRRVGSTTDAEDIVAETLTAATLARKFPPEPTDGDDMTRAYLFGIARRKSSEVLRKRGRRKESSLEDAQSHLAPTPDDALSASERSRSLRALLDSLPAEWRDALILKYVDGLTLAELAVALNRSEAATNSLLQRARNAARERGGTYFDSKENSDAR